MTNIWLAEEEARRVVDESIDLFSPEREAIQEIVREDARPSLRHRISRAFAGARRHDERQSFDEADTIIIEPGDLMGTRYVVWRPERFDY